MAVKYRTQVFKNIQETIAGLDSSVERFACSRRAEKLRDQLHGAVTYAPPELAKYVLCVLDESANGFRTTNEPRIIGDDAIHDLSRLIHDLSADTIIATEDVLEPVLTTEELAARWSVSAKTIGRWRDRGLTARTFMIEGRSRIGFLQSTAERFERNHPNLVRRGSRFSRMSEDERQHILRRAQDMLDGLMLDPTEVVARLAADTQRSVETVRALLKQGGLLDDPSAGKPSDRSVKRLYREFCRGKSTAWLAKQSGWPRWKVTLAINRLRAERIQEVPLEFMPSDEFSEPGANEKILAPLPENPGPIRMPRKPPDLPAYIASLYEVPLLTSEQETYLFRQYNFLKYKVSRLRQGLDPKRPSGRTLDQIERLYEQALAVNNKLVRSNLRLVVAVAKKYVGPTGDLFEKVSEGNVSLMRAVEKFDYTRGFKFSTYATWAIKKNFIRAYVTAMKHADRFRTGHDQLLDARVGYRANPRVELEAQRLYEQQVACIMQDLSERERDIIQSRFGMKPGVEPKTLQEVGNELGVSKERVRQLESRAMKKLRQAATQARFDEYIALSD